MSTPSLAQQCCNHGTGLKRVIKIRGETEKREFWINADLIYADRKADWESRTLMRKQKQERIDRAKAAAATKQAYTPAPSAVQEKPASSVVPGESDSSVVPEEPVMSTTVAEPKSVMPQLTPIVSKTSDKVQSEDSFR